MFERFTDRARRAIELAQDEARLVQHDYIGTEHLLLGLISESAGVAGQVLTDMGLSVDRLRHDVLELIGTGESATKKHIPFTPRAKKVLELSLREALQLGHNYIGTEHLLLGLIREGQGVAAQIMETRHDLDLAEVRLAVVRSLRTYEKAVGAEELSSRATEEVWRRARRLRRKKGYAPQLTAREAEVLGLLIREVSKKEQTEVARRLFIRLDTMQKHLQNVAEKLELPDRLAPEREASISGPKCPGCDASLSESARYSLMDVQKDDGSANAHVMFLYCSSCGETLDDLIVPEEE